MAWGTRSLSLILEMVELMQGFFFYLKHLVAKQSPQALSLVIIQTHRLGMLV